MKKILSALLLLTIYISSCKKNDTLTGDTTSPNGIIAQPKSIPAFKINNLQSGNYVVEGKNLRLENLSTNAITYHWDFGNGITYDGKTPPKDIYYVPCGGSYTITLTTTNKAGEQATFSQPVKILCSGRLTHGTHLPD